MGLTHIDLTVANPAKPSRAAKLRFLVDSGAAYSVVPSAVLRRLGIRPSSKRTFILADGTSIDRKLGNALFRLNGQEGASPVVFGEEGDSILVGFVSLEALGLILDPIRRELRPMPMLLTVKTPSQQRRLR